MVEVAGSIPAGTTIYVLFSCSHRLAAKDTALSRRRQGFKSPWGYHYGPIAQLGERLNGIQEVVGSIPSGSTNEKRDKARNSEFFYFSPILKLAYD